MTDPTPTPDAPAPDLLMRIDLGEPVTLRDCEPGLFMFNGSFGFKTEYAEEIPAGSKQYWPGAYCLDSGEFFWGGVSKHEDRAKLMVRPAALRAERDEAQPVAWRCFDRITEQYSAIMDRRHAELRRKHPVDWLVEPLYAHPPATSPGAAGGEEAERAAAEVEAEKRYDWTRPGPGSAAWGAFQAGAKWQRERVSPGGAGDADLLRTGMFLECTGQYEQTGKPKYYVEIVYRDIDELHRCADAHRRLRTALIGSAPATAEVDRVRALEAALRQIIAELTCRGNKADISERTWLAADLALRSEP